MAGKSGNTIFNTYLSHSYRGGDAELNRKYWSAFAENSFSFLVDARSDYFSLLYLETMMRRSHCFVAVVPARTEQPGYSPYIKFEFDMARLARKPRFVVRSTDASADAFPISSRDMQQEFDHFTPDNCLPELEYQVREFRERVMAHGAQAVSRSHHIGVLLSSGTKRPPGFAELSDQLREVGGKHNYAVEILDPKQLSHGDLASLDHYDLLVIDASGHYVPSDMFGFAHSRLIPSIKLVPLGEGDFPSTARLPLVSAKLQKTLTDPLIYWRNPEELILAVDRELTGLERLITEDMQQAKTTQDAARYFRSLGRARLRVFLSNASEDGELALIVAEALRTRYIDVFHYKDPRELRAGVNWRLQVAREVTHDCGMFVMLSSRHYWSSNFCNQEFQAAKSRHAQGEMVILPFQIGSGRMDRLGNIQTSDMTQARYRHLTPSSLADEIADLIVEEMNLEGTRKDGLIRAQRITSLHAEATVDVRPEAVIAGRDESLPVQWLHDAYQSCRSIARIQVFESRGGKARVARRAKRSWYGTGWLIDEGILVTNYHVIAGTDQAARTEEDVNQQAMDMKASFGFTKRRSATRQFRVDEVLATDQNLDYAVVRLHSFAEDKQPGLEDSQLAELDPVSTIKFWGRLELQPASTLVSGTRLNVVQHPGGGKMMVAFRQNKFDQLSSDGRTIEYSTDTREGSSGSPVFDDNWVVRALHSHAVMAPGSDGADKQAAANRGITIETIVADLRNRHGLTIKMRRREVEPFELGTP